MKKESSKSEQGTVNQLYLLAAEKITGKYDLTKEQQKAITTYIKVSMRRLHCCVLWNRDASFLRILASVGISPDSIKRKEVVITERYVLLYSSDYKKNFPILVRQPKIKW